MSLLIIVSEPKIGCKTHEENDFEDELCHLQCWCSKGKAMCGAPLDLTEEGNHTGPDGADCNCLKCIVCYELNNTGCPDCGR